MKKPRNRKRKQNTLPSECPPEKIAKEIVEGTNSEVKMKKKKSKSKKKRVNQTKTANALSDAACSSMAANASNEEMMEVEKAEDVPVLKIDLGALFSISGSRASGSHLHCNDIKNLLLYTVLGTGRWERPNWCNMTAWNNVKHTLFIMVGHVSGGDYITYKECFKNIDKHFTYGYPTKNDGSEGAFISPLETYLHYRMKKKAAKHKRKNSEGMLPIELTLTTEQRIVNEYPYATNSLETIPDGFVCTRKTKCGAKKDLMAEEKADTTDCRMFAIDCEMCNTLNGKELTRVSMVNENLEVVYDTYVKPDAEITDYLTEYSGITAQILKEVKTNLGDVQQHILEIISEDDILIGHSLENDLRCVKILHDKFIDTSVIYGDQRGSRYKPSLKRLVKDHLQREIQNNEAGHCSIEDSKACMELVQLKLEKGKYYGLLEKPNESIFEAFSRANKTSVVVDTPLIARQHCFLKTHGVICSSDEEVVKGTKSYTGKASFIFSHLKQFEHLMKDCDRNQIKAENERVKATMKQLDDNLGEIIEAAAKNTLVVVLFSSGYLPSNIQALQRDKERRKTDEVKMAVKKARDCICFVKVIE